MKFQNDQSTSRHPSYSENTHVHMLVMKWKKVHMKRLCGQPGIIQVALNKWYYYGTKVSKLGSSGLRDSEMKCAATFLINMLRNPDRSSVSCVSLLERRPKHGSTYPSTSPHTSAKWSSGSCTAHPSLRKYSLMKWSVFSSTFSRPPCLHSMRTVSCLNRKAIYGKYEKKKKKKHLRALWGC